MVAGRRVITLDLREGSGRWSGATRGGGAYGVPVRGRKHQLELTEWRRRGMEGERERRGVH